jgi:hypothetical protein
MLGMGWNWIQYAEGRIVKRHIGLAKHCFSATLHNKVCSTGAQHPMQGHATAKQAAALQQLPANTAQLHWPAPPYNSGKHSLIIWDEFL